jgi:hypothetical protein
MWFNSCTVDFEYKVYPPILSHSTMALVDTVSCVSVTQSLN